MIRIPDAGRFEFRQADGAANPCLPQAVELAAGPAGIANQREPRKRLPIDMYVEGHMARGARKLPPYLLDAIRAFERDKALRSATSPAAPASSSRPGRGTITRAISPAGNAGTRWTAER